MSLSTGSSPVASEQLAPAPLPATIDGTHPCAGDIGDSMALLLAEIDTDGARTAQVSKAWQRLSKRNGRAASLDQSVTESHYRRRLTAPLLDFVSALRGAISAFGQGHVRARQELTLRQLTDIKSFLGCSLERSVPEATRVLYVGELSPHSGVVDLLSCVIAWAERHRDTPVDICWAGRGDLQGVLRAQSTPPNMTQSFTHIADDDALCALVAHCGIFAVPASGIVDLFPLAKSMAAGLPVLGSARSPEVCMLVTPAETGWLFDPVSPNGMSIALDAALSTPASQLAAMRTAARHRLTSVCDEWVGAEREAGLREHSALLAGSGQA